MIRLTQWSDRAHECLTAVKGLDVEDIRDEVVTGISQLWECCDDFGSGFVVTRLEQHKRTGEREWIWLACAGKGFRHFVQAFLVAAKENNLSVRVYVRRPGMRRMYESLGFKADTTVLRLSHVIR